MSESRESRMVTLRRKPDGTPAVWCDPEIADLVSALNAGGVPTIASCSGHGERPGNIALADGRELIIAKDYAEARAIEACWNTRPAPSAEVVGEPWGVTVTKGGWTGTYEEWKRRHGIKPAAPTEAEVEAMNEAAKLSGLLDGIAAECKAPDYQPVITAAELRKWAEIIRSSLRMARAALGVEAENKRLRKELAAATKKPGAVDEAMVERCTDAAIASSAHYRSESIRDSWRRLVRDVLAAALTTKPAKES